MANEKSNLITEAGLQKLQEELDNRISVVRNEIAKEIEFARSYGDLSENAEYTEAKNKQAANETEIARLQAAIRSAVVVSEDQISAKTISLGTTAKLLDMVENEIVEYSIVGAEEADPFEGKVSNESPVGAALQNAAKGDVVEFEIPAGLAQYKVLNIRLSDNAEYDGEDAE